MTPIQRAIRTGFRSVQRLSGEFVVFRCDLGELTVKAVPGRSEREAISDQGIVRYEAKDFLVEAEQLVFDGERYEPRGGERIVFGGRVYEVLAQNGLDCFRYMDQTQELMRIHTKHVDDEACA